MAGYFCTMVRGPCRGKMCDVWARAKLKKATVEDLITGIRNSVEECEEGCLSVPEIYEKVQRAETVTIKVKE